MLLLMMTLLTDEDRQFVERVFKKNRRLFLAIASRILGSKTEAEDAVSDAMVQIITNLDKIYALPRHEIQRYCIVIVKNSANARFRGKYDAISFESVDMYVSSQEHEPGISILRRERINDVKRLISTLSEEDRLFVELRYYHKSSYREIGQVFGISEETARKRAERILKKLRRQVGEDLYCE